MEIEGGDCDACDAGTGAIGCPATLEPIAAGAGNAGAGVVTGRSGMGGGGFIGTELVGVACATAGALVEPTGRGCIPVEGSSEGGVIGFRLVALRLGSDWTADGGAETCGVVADGISPLAVRMA